MESTRLECSECGEPITAARLKAQPGTTLCVGCKTKTEKQPKLTTRENPEKVKKSRKGRSRGGPDLSRVTEIG
jgi:RNA polymerase-binding transcription factor DksA